MAGPGQVRGGGAGRGSTRLVERVLRHPSTRWVVRATGISTLRSSFRWRAEHSCWLEHDDRLQIRNGSVMRRLDEQTPAEVAAANAEMVLSSLDESGIPYTKVRRQTVTRVTVAVPRRYRRQLLDAFSTHHANDPIYVATVATYAPGQGEEASVVPASLLSKGRRPVARFGDQIDTAAVVRVWQYYVDYASGFVLGPSYGCEIELWEESDQPAARWIAPRVNVAGMMFSDSDVALVPRKRQSVDAPPSVLDLHMIDDIDFPIDVVYTWVDSSDPEWRQKFESYSGRNLAEDFHHEAKGDQRFRSRDELRYSLRSLSMYAPWVRHVYIVTDDQVPEFINFDKPGITLVDHSEIAKVPEALPVFNSSAITTWLHRIPELSEHYIYLNDDVFIGREVSPARFYTPSGLARVFPSHNRRPFGSPSALDEPHINITRNIRALLEREFGRSISRSVKHTPHAQLLSVQLEMEKRFPDAYDRTSRSRFRHHDDIAADQLFHYYGQITGRAVAGSIRYAYVNTGDRRNEPELERLLATRGREVFCINDVPEEDAEPMTDATVRGFLDAYFPLPSKWEWR